MSFATPRRAHGADPRGFQLDRAKGPAIDWTEPPSPLILPGTHYTLLPHNPVVKKLRISTVWMSIPIAGSDNALQCIPMTMKVSGN